MRTLFDAAGKCFRMQNVIGAENYYHFKRTDPNSEQENKSTT
jgi:hypothetical protein